MDPSNNIIDSRLMSSGEYQLHLFIQETRGLILSKDKSSLIDPIIKIQAFNKEKHSKTKENRGSGMIYWGEHFFFEKLFITKSEFEQEKLLIQVFDHNIIGSNSLIGDFELDLISIYFSENRTIQHQWTALSNYKVDFQEIKGFLKFSVTCAGPDDQQISLLDDPVIETDAKNEIQRVLMPPQIQTKGWQMIIKLFRAENLVKMDNFGGSIDAFFIFSFGSVKFKTEIIKNNLNPVWNCIIKLPFSEPTINDILTIKVFDWDMGKDDELVGCNTFSKKKMLTGQYKDPFWVNIYGAQTDPEDSKLALIINNNPSLGALWKGRILLSFEVIQDENPKLSIKQENLEPKIIQQYKDFELIEWELKAEIYYGICFPSLSEEYSIEIRWAEYQIEFSKILSAKGVWEWYSSKSMKCDFFSKKTEDLPDVFIYLKEGSKRISFFRKPADFFFHQLMESPQYITFKPDLSKKPSLKENDAGIIRIRCTLGLSGLFDNMKINKWNEPINNPNTSRGFLYVNMYHAKNLIPADSSGSSDPYYTIQYYDVKETGPKTSDSLNPVWYLSHKMIIPFAKIDDLSPVIISFFDTDTLASDDFIGNIVINLKQGIKEGWVNYNKFEIPEPVWLNILYNGKEGGNLLASFNLFDSIPMNKEINIYPQTEKYIIKIRILGLRDLKSLGILEVKRPFIKFDIDSLRIGALKQTLKERKKIETLPKDVGPNPNIPLMISVEMDLPKITEICPTLNCVVHDCIYKGLIQPILGHFSIDIGFYIKQSKEKLKKKYRKSSKTFFDKTLLNEIFSPSPKLIEKNNSSPIKEIELSEDKEFGLKKPLLDINEKNIDLEIKNDSLNKKKMSFDRRIINEKQINSLNIVVKANYEFDKEGNSIVETEIPDSNFFMALGYDEKEIKLKNENTKKHYRHFVNCNLEETKFMDKLTFDEFNITRGKRLLTENTILETKKEGGDIVGKFKGWVDIVSKANEEKAKSKLFPTMDDCRSFESLTVLGNSRKIDINTEFMEKNPCIIRVYIISAMGLAQLDEDSLSDPYLVVNLGSQSQNNQKDYQTDKTDCDFNCMFEFKSTLPGASQLKIQVWDKDFLVKDDLIGETSIDLENRFFSKRWRKLSYIPIETRTIYHPLSKLPKGKLRLWVEIIPITYVEEIKNIWNITPRPPCPYELRVVVWDIEDVPSQDIEDCSDLYVTAMVGEKQQKTDVHYRAQKGAGSFNWRMVWDDIELPLKDPSITFQIWDKDFLSPNDFIAEATISFKKEAELAYINENSIKIYGKSEVKIKQKSEEGKEDIEKKIVRNEEKFMIELKNVKKDGFKFCNVGKMNLSFELVPKSIAKTNPVGLGRSEPNNSPWLPPPVGRFEWSWNPFKLFNNCVGPKARAKICWCICVCICTAIIISLAPTIFGSLISASIKKIF